MPIRIPGAWDEGFVLSQYTVSSVYMGESAFGHPQFETKYTPTGQLLHDMKYNGHFNTSAQIISQYEEFIKGWLLNKSIDCVIPVPPTKERSFQPVVALAEEISRLLSIGCYTDVLEKTTITETKSMPKEDRDLNDAFRQIKPAKRPCSILLVDDFYSSGQTANACTNLLKSDPLIKRVFFLAVAKTK